MSTEGQVNPVQGDTGGLEDDEIDLLQLVEVVAANLRLLVFGPLLVGVLALAGAFVVTPTFTARAVIVPPQAQQSGATAILQSLGALGGVAGAATGIKNPADQIVSLMKSRTVADRLIDRFSLADRYKTKFADDTRKRLASLTRITSGKDGLIEIEFDDPDPTLAAEIANAYVEELSQLLTTIAISEAQLRRMFFEKQLKDAKGKLTQAERALKAGGVEAGALKASPDTAVTALAQVQAQIAAQEVKLGAMRNYLTETAPQFRQALVELQALRTQLEKLERTEQMVDGVDDYVTRFRDFKYYETMFDLMAKQYEIARVDESRDNASVQIVDRAVPPERKSKPKRALIAVLASLASGFVLLLFVFVRNAMANAQQDPQSAQRIANIRRLLKGFWRRPA